MSKFYNLEEFESLTEEFNDVGNEFLSKTEIWTRIKITC